MSKVAMSLLVVLSINLFLTMGQFAVEGINPSAKIFDRGTTLLNTVDAGGYTLNESVSSQLPNSEGNVVSTAVGSFTDFFVSIKSWITDLAKGAKYFTAMINAVPNFLKALGLPSALTFLLGAFWNVYTLMLIFMFFWGDRN